MPSTYLIARFLGKCGQATSYRLEYKPSLSETDIMLYRNVSEEGLHSVDVLVHALRLNNLKLRRHFDFVLDIDYNLRADRTETSRIIA
jgi:hypothetical protein